MLRLLITAAVLGVAPLSAMAACGHSEARMTCADGLVYDAATRSCVEQTTS